jgi:predicted DNA-binding mobile mystery protein A
MGVEPDMKDNFRWLKLRQLDRQLDAWHSATARSPAPREGWLRALRTALGMTTGQLARRLGTRQPWVMQLEKSETKGTVTLASLQKAADALDCDLVYALVPRVPLEARIRRQAERLAKAELVSVSHTMALEKQSTGKAVESRQFKELRDDLLAGPWRRLWK